MASPPFEAVPQFSLSTVLGALTDSISSALSSLPSNTPHEESGDGASILPPVDGISLLDTKNEILLSYLQNLVFLLLLQVRQVSAPQPAPGTTRRNVVGSQPDEVIKKLTELRVYLERGTKPLEGKLKYQIDKVLKATDDAERAQRSSLAKKPRTRRENIGSDDDDNSSAESDFSDEGTELDSEEDEEIDELAYRPNLAAFSRGAQDTAEKAASQKSNAADGIYRPPKIKPTALPAEFSDRRSDREGRRPGKSRVIDEFVSAEMSAAPTAEPSIGSTIRAGGREVRTLRQREIETERRTYEETNFVRLPKESKKDRAKKGGNKQGGFGGEDWRSLGEGADRIKRLTRRGRGSGGVLEKSRKRRLTEDGPRGDGINVGEGFEKRRKKIAGWKK
ncbi:hypothetical protein D8B26_000592 [Coccidioides posadasii str. Silveira]|uniref:uncharacterized protein n=1 Tax=Coccidioides posadasii (strain RMSCC 757 / Silveira) TaxID=443226 RepID=UPI001BF0D4CC|nr:hypothetical protein D8B26_000592 [Coccidioides posadasii str. Silveira]